MALMMPMMVCAQWRVGVNVGADRNHFIIDKQFQTDYKYTNNYLQLPVMASFGFGGEKVRGFCNLGCYGGYWLNSNRKGVDTNSFTDKSYDFTEKVEFNSERDQRWDFGFVAGAGVEYRFAEHWAAQAELRYYYSTTSVQKPDYSGFKDPRYNSTLAIQAGVWYCF